MIRQGTRERPSCLSMKEDYALEVSGNVDDLRQLLVFAILAVIAQVFLLFALSWNVVVIIVCIILDILLFIAGLVDWLYFSRKIILDAYGCAFVSLRATKKFTWEEIHLQHAENSLFLFGDSEIPGEGIILSVKPISKPMHIGAMTYCRFTHPCTSVFIRFSSPFDRLTRTSAKFVYSGFVADKDEMLDFLRRRTGDGSAS